MECVYLGSDNTCQCPFHGSSLCSSLPQNGSEGTQSNTSRGKKFPKGRRQRCSSACSSCQGAGWEEQLFLAHDKRHVQFTAARYDSEQRAQEELDEDVIIAWVTGNTVFKESQSFGSKRHCQCSFPGLCRVWFTEVFSEESEFKFWLFGRQYGWINASLHSFCITILVSTFTAV